MVARNIEGCNGGDCVMKKRRIMVVCTTDSMIWNFLVPHIKKLENDGYVVECACSVTGEYFENLKSQHNLVMHRVDFERSPYNLRNISAFFELKKLIKDRNIDMIFCHEPVGGAMGRMVGHVQKCKVIYMAHGFHFYKGAPKTSKIYYVVEKILSKYTDVLITINQEDYEASLKLKAKKNYLLPGIGIDTSKFIYNPDSSYIRTEFDLKSDDLIILSVGELITRKNHETVIEAVAKLQDPHIHYMIAGEGELEDYLRKKIKNLGVQNIHMLGYRKDINKLCNSADIFIMPSYQEGLSVALMEAMACGLPVIASNIRGNVDLIPDDKYGRLVNADDTCGYCNAIRELSMDVNKRVVIGMANRDRVKLFDIETVKSKLYEIIVKQ